MATILDAPSALGTYMLKGWVLTNRPCPNNGCKIPLLRSPAGQAPVVHLCVNCDGSSDAPRQLRVPLLAEEPQVDTSTSNSSTSHITRASTPATEVSEAEDDLPPFVETEAMRRRREQTDRASAEIGRRLLQGWTMLGDECPRDACYYVPLVRPPKAGSEQNPKKECVLCGSIYTTEKDWAGREQLVQVSAESSSGGAAPINQASPVQTSVKPPQQIARPDASWSISVVPSEQHSVGVASAPLRVSSPIIDTLDSSAKALQLALQTLTSRLTSLSANSTLADPASIATTADAISKVTQALSQVKQLQWSEAQAHTMT
ncbi:hypothetical protein P691DRAFT_756399 [Macrolepiota fuliginosa MF-IS2]|uniref:Uncharacterized protein n=1 Tax=Macrolepiota fuliginosa MF-IS2 TaxID=1400762 RepID=A0A9P5XL65_9AGAR|nr:hypothetical protein P691DRAFT_756399 [Macrolepiota fuliginosa MF-IS2]